MKRWVKGSALALMLAMLATVGGCGQGVREEEQEMEQQAVQAAPAKLVMKAEAYPRVDGSTVTIPLSEAVASAVLHLPFAEARTYVLHNKTHQAYCNLIERKADIIFVTQPSADELDYAREMGVELVVTPIVSEGFVFLTNQDNPVDNLSLAQVQDIYAGVITNWSEVGGADQEIVAYQRQENSGSQTGMLDLVMQQRPMMEPPRELVPAEMGALIDAVAGYDNGPSAIGYSYYYYASGMWRNEGVKLLAIDGVQPDGESIASGQYPITTAYYAVTRGDMQPDDAAGVLRDWILSDEGQQVAEEAGYVKLGE